jgi:nondiscriminating aspartyl-tRNA synthetase
MIGDIHRSHFTSDLNQSLVDHKVKIAGWIEDIRDIGKLAFLIIRDSSGAAQAIVTGENLDLARETPRQSAVILSGLVQNTKAKDFPVEVKVEEFKLLTKAVQPLPIDPTGRVESALDKRLDCRALDLRNPKISAIFRLRSEALHNIRETLRSRGFIEVTTPKVIGSASEGGANLFSLGYFKTNAYLA